MALNAKETNYSADHPPVEQKLYNFRQGIWNILYKNTHLIGRLLPALHVVLGEKYGVQQHALKRGAGMKRVILGWKSVLAGYKVHKFTLFFEEGCWSLGCTLVGQGLVPSLGPMGSCHAGGMLGQKEKVVSPSLCSSSQNHSQIDSHVRHILFKDKFEIYPATNAAIRSRT